MTNSRNSTGETIKDVFGGDLTPFYKRETVSAIKHKFVKVAEGESWYGDWLVNGVPHFLVLLNRSAPGGKQCGVFCEGTDDYDMAARDMDLADAEDLFRKIKDGMSYKDLETLGLQRDG